MNTFINSPKILNKHLQTKKFDNIFFAGQLTGVEANIKEKENELYELQKEISEYQKQIDKIQADINELNYSINESKD